MKFARVGDHTIKCTITEQEIDDLGFTMEEILTNGIRTQEFMNIIFDMAEDEFQTKFDFGIKTVRADFLPDHTLTLTFSGHPAGSMTEHLKDIIDGLLHSIPESAKEEWKDAVAPKQPKTEGSSLPEVPIIAGIVFPDLDTVGRFATNLRVEAIPPSVLYKYLDVYVLVVDFMHSTENTVESMSREADEYALDISVAMERLAHITEHGELLLKEKALENLQEVYG